MTCLVSPESHCFHSQIYGFPLDVPLTLLPVLAGLPGGFGERSLSAKQFDTDRPEVTSGQPGQGKERLKTL